MTAKPQAVIYEVNLSIDVNVIERFDEWLQQHCDEMLGIPGFISAAISVPNIIDGDRKYRCVQYQLSDQDALDDYLNYYAAKMEAKADLAFEGEFTASSRVLSVSEAALVEHRACANCGAELTGRFCAACGQREEQRVPSIGAVIGEFTNEVFVLESKLWRSLRMLLLKPGQLTSVYLSGQRQKYMSPLRLYLLFSILTFAYFGSLNGFGDLDLGIESNSGVEITDKANSANVTEDKQNQENDSPSADIFTEEFANEFDAEVEKGIRSALSSIRSDIEAGNQKAVIDKFMQPLPKALFIFLPFVALLFKILFLGSGKYYVEHLIYVLHNHAFLFAVIMFDRVVAKLARLWPKYEVYLAFGITLFFSICVFCFLRDFVVRHLSNSKKKGALFLVLILGLFFIQLSFTLSDGISAPLGLLWNLYVPYYIYRSMRVVYQRSRWITIPSLVIISVVYLVLLFIMISSSVVLVGYSYS
ncbi:MAG: DUF4286 family protein [Acidiferrobacterales bacterium]|nr:DUF4286 family protein [Acidiferrobacterales bacterium]